MPLLSILLMYATWSLMFPLSKLALQIAPPVFLTAIRMLGASVLLLLFLLMKGRQNLKIEQRQLLPLLLLAVLSIYLTNILEFWAAQHLPAVKTCFIYGLSPFFAMLLSYLHFQEKITLRKGVGILIGLTGFLPVVMQQGQHESLMSLFQILSWPTVAMIGAAFFSVYGWVLLRLFVKNHKLSPLYVNGYSMLFGGGLALVHSFFVDRFDPLPIVPGQTGHLLMLLGAMIVISNIICYNWYGLLLRQFTATILSFCGLLSPLFVSLSGWLLLGEPPSLAILLSTGVVLIGLSIVYHSELRQGYIQRHKARPLKVPPPLPAD